MQAELSLDIKTNVPQPKTHLLLVRMLTEEVSVMRLVQWMHSVVQNINLHVLHGRSLFALAVI